MMNSSKNLGLSNENDNDMFNYDDDESNNDTNDTHLSSKTNSATSIYGNSHSVSNSNVIMKPLNISSSSSTTSLQSEDPIETTEQVHLLSWPARLHHWLYPPNVPKQVQLFRIENIAIPVCYLTVGLIQGLAGPLINVYPLDLGATEAQQATLSSLRGLPASFKIVFGFISDLFPFWGYRRKSYMLLGWALASCSMFALLWCSDVSLPETNEETRSLEEEEENSSLPSIPLLSITFLLSGVGFWFADVMADSLVAEKAKLEPEETRGQLQSSCYACRFFGLMVAAPFSSYIYSAYGPKFVIYALGILPLIVVPFVCCFKEKKMHSLDISIRDQCLEIWQTVCSRAVWQPMGFVYLYNVMQVGNAAWREFLKSVLGFTANQLNALLIAAYVLLYLGVMAYKYYFISWSWRSVYVFTTLLNGIFSLLQVCLIMGWTFGFGNFLFALGDDAFMDFIGGIQFLPTTIMMVHLCPTGSEGASYAMFTTVNNSALNLSGAFSTMMLSIWDVSKETMMSGDLSGMVKLTLLTTLIQTAAIIFVKLLPASRDDLITLHNDKLSGSKVGGSIFLFITISSVLYAVFVGIMNIVAPGWMGES